jgi:thioredoxin 1
MGNLKEVNESNFESEVINGDKPTLVDFWAEWCGPCKALGPVLEEIADEIGEKARIVKVNVDNAQGLAQKYGIKGIPTLLFFKDGEVKTTLVGNQPKDEILKSLEEIS